MEEDLNPHTDLAGGLEWSLLLMTLRTLRGWTQAELAKAAGLYRTAVARQEREVHAPSIDGRRALERALGVEGRARQVEVFLGELRARMIDPGKRSEYRGLAAEIQQAAAESSQLMQYSLWLGLEQLRGGGDEEPLAWGRFISTLRTLRGWNQAELGQAAGVSGKTISKQEIGEREPTDIVKEKLERALLGTSTMSERVRIQLGGLRAMMLAPKVASVMAGIEEAGAMTTRFIEAALRSGFEEIFGRGERESAAPTRLPGLDEKV
jgi:transcriptional regulator with XRE-family HTH domain